MYSLLGGVVDTLTALAPADDAARIDALRELEEAKAVLAAAQARITAEFVISQERAAKARAAERSRVAKEEGFEAFRALKDAERAIAAAPAQVALARRISPYQGNAAVTFATALSTDLPGTYAALAAGRISEWRAAIIARETSHLSAELRREADEQITADPERLAGYGDKRLTARIRAIAYGLDAAGALARARAAAKDRRVSARPKPDTMMSITSLLTMTDGAAVYGALERAATHARATGDPRTRGQVMADTLVERVTGRVPTDPVPVQLQVIVSDATLTGLSDTPARVPGYGPVPAGQVRDLLADPATPVWLRRLWATPSTGRLVAMETTGRAFTGAQRAYLTVRDDGICRTPWCDAPVRHADHVTAHTEDGPTAIPNGQGLCEACNYRRIAPDWTARTIRGPSDHHTVRITTPTGHHYDSTAPPLLPTGAPGADYSWIEHRLRHALAA